MAGEKTLVVRILADTQSAEAGMDKVTTKTQGMGEQFKQAAADAARDLAGRAVKAVWDFANDSVRAFSELEQAQGGTVAVFGESAKAIDDAAKTSAQSIGLSEAEFRTATTSIGGQLKRMTGDVDFAAERSVALTGVAADLAATYGGTTAEAVQALGAAFRGEADPAERFNLDLKIGRVNAKAVELGLAETTTSVDDYAKAQATLALIMEQSTDAQGQFAREADTVAGKSQIAAAEIENMKARAGEALVPFKQLTTDLELLGAKTLGIVATGLQHLFGQIDTTTAAIQEFEIHTGAAADTAAAAATIVKEYATSFSELLPRLDLSREELEKLRDADDALLESMGFTEEQVDDLRDAVGRELASAFTDGEAAARETTAAMAALRAEQEDTEEATEDTTSALEEQTSTLRAMSDPLFGVIKSSRDLEAAQKAYDEAVKAGDTEAQLKAIEDITGANVGLRDSYSKLVEQGIDPTSQAARRMFEDVGGLTPKQIDQILDTFRSIQSSMPVLDLRVMAPGIEYQERANKITPRSSQEYLFAEGGIARATPGGIPARIAEAGSDEVVSPLDQLVGMIRAAVATELAGTRGGGGGGAIVLQVNASRGQALDGWAIVEALQKIERSSGPIPISVRGI